MKNRMSPPCKTIHVHLCLQRKQHMTTCFNSAPPISQQLRLTKVQRRGRSQRQGMRNKGSQKLNGSRNQKRGVEKGSGKTVMIESGYLNATHRDCESRDHHLCRLMLDFEPQKVVNREVSVQSATGTDVSRFHHRQRLSAQCEADRTEIQSGEDRYTELL